MHFNPTDIQTIGVGLAAFLATLAFIVIFLSARKESLARAILFVLGAMSVWAWFGFFYEIIFDTALARVMRVISVMGIVWIAMATLHFSMIYLEERMQFGKRNKDVLNVLIGTGALITLILIADLFGTRLVVGNLDFPSDHVLAPKAGPLFGFIIVYYTLSTLLSGLFLALRARASFNLEDKRRVELVFLSLIVALTLGGTRFAAWYGLESYPFLSVWAGPLFIFTAFYSIRRYKLFNIEIAIAQLFIFLLWTFAFFRMLLSINTPSAPIEVFFFVAVLILGIFLLHSIIAEIRSQKKLARLTLEESKSEFATIAAHELREPFSVIRTAFNHLASSTQKLSAKEQQHYIEQGRDASNRLISLLDNLLNIVHISKGSLHFDKEPGDVRNAVRSGTNIFEDALREKDINLVLCLGEEPLRANFDRGKLAFAIENVFDNAIKYSQAKSTITINALREGERIIVTITDSGIGILKKDLERIFEKFFRGENAIQMVPDGSGLGLYLARHIIEAHGGTISLSTPKEGGTIATIILPTLSL